MLALRVTESTLVSQQALLFAGCYRCHTKRRITDRDIGTPGHCRTTTIQGIANARNGHTIDKHRWRTLYQITRVGWAFTASMGCIAIRDTTNGNTIGKDIRAGRNRGSRWKTSVTSAKITKSGYGWHTEKSFYQSYVLLNKKHLGYDKLLTMTNFFH